ncbi:MAG: FAD:protein FMN transferase [Dysgonamonadaceae bacterium]|jgi:thiamine biosynthesis lipoprotein|nr:FAD:protein FMN transferase [Dysgonamonadaceae bacterium]
MRTKNSRATVWRRLARKALCGLWGAIALLTTAVSCRESPSYHLSQGAVFHTSFHIKYEYNTSLGKQIQAVLDSFNVSLNVFNDTSLIARINANEEVEADDYFVAVFNKSMEISRLSGGMFDITCAPLINLWGFGFSEMDSITPQRVDSVRAFVGYRKVRLQGRKVIKDDPRVLLNMSAIAKGYSCDMIARMFDSYAIQNYLIEIGGEIRAKGVNPNGVCWRVEIAKPEEDPLGLIHARQEVIQLCDLSLATSGSYRNYRVRDGKKYAHIIDPLTGYPAEQEILSATVVAADCMTADAYATTFMTLGLEKACRLGDAIQGLAYYFVYLDQQDSLRVKYSEALQKLIPDAYETFMPTVEGEK